MGFVTDLFGAGEAKQAARAQEEGYRTARSTYQDAGTQALGRYSPYAETSLTANRMIDATLEGDFSDFYESPGYQFRLDQGNRAISRGAAARGMNLSGATLKDLNRFGQDLASTEYGNWYNRMANLRGEGIGIAGQQAGIDMTTGQQVAGTQLGEAGARASGYLAEGNIKKALMGNLLGSVADIGTAYATDGLGG